MRTTLSIDDDLLHTVKQRAVEAHTSLSDVVNRALRRGLAEQAPSRVAAPTVVYGTTSAEPIDAATLRAREAALENEEALRKLGR
jgi:Arc/MetJ family transcription regulator